MKPYAYQQKTIDWLRDRSSSLVCHEPGLGKSLIAAESAEPPALVVCPASVRRHWRRTIEEQRPGDASQFEVMSYADRDLFLMNPRHFRSLIIDEVHFVKTPTSQRSRTVCKLARRIGRKGKVIALSGTLVPNRPIELWPILYSMRFTDMDYLSFAYRYAAAYEDEWGELDVRGASNLDELRDLLAPDCMRYLKTDVLDELPSKTWRVLALDLPPGEAEKEFTVSGLRRMRDSIAQEAMSTILKEQGMRKLPQVVEHCKLALEEEPKIVVFAHHRDMIEALCEKLNFYRPVRLWGGMSDKQKDLAVQCFRDDPECRVFVGQIQAAGTGVDGLQHAANRVIFAEGSWVPSDLQQASDRLHRLGQELPVLVDVLTIDGSIDEAMLRKALEKQEIVDQILPTDTFEDPLA